PTVVRHRDRWSPIRVGTRLRPKQFGRNARKDENNQGFSCAGARPAGRLGLPGAKALATLVIRGQAAPGAQPSAAGGSPRPPAASPGGSGAPSAPPASGASGAPPAPPPPPSPPHPPAPP